jgi:hypothetical protein
MVKMFFRWAAGFCRDENPTGPGFGPGPKTLIFLNFKNPEPGPKPECDFPETLNPNPNPKFKNLGPAENPVQFFFIKLKLENKIRVQKSSVPHSSIFKFDSNFLPKIGQKDSFLWGRNFFLFRT